MKLRAAESTGCASVPLRAREFDRIVAALERAGINDAHLALD